MPITDEMIAGETPRPVETPLQRQRRIRTLQRLVAKGDYFVPSEALARALLRHLGRLLAEPLPQQR